MNNDTKQRCSDCERVRQESRLHVQCQVCADGGCVDGPQTWILRADAIESGSDHLCACCAKATGQKILVTASGRRYLDGGDA